MTQETTQTVSIDWQEFYNKLGYLYFGIAAASGPLNADNMDALRRCVSRLWTAHQNELVDFQGYTPNKVDALFDWLGLNETDWEYCVNEFAYFAKKHHDDMPAHMKKFALDSAAEVSRFLGNPENEAFLKLREMLG